MNKSLLLLIISLIFSSLSAIAQCYIPARQQGIRSFNAKDYNEALTYFSAAKDCDDKPQKNDIDSWIEKCRNLTSESAALSLEPATLELPSVGGTQTIRVKTEASNYFIGEHPTWMKINKQGDYFEIAIPSNHSEEVRNFVLEIKAGNDIEKLPVIQQSKISELEKRKRDNALVVPLVIEGAKPIPVGNVPTEPVPLQLDKDSLFFQAEGGNERIQITTHDLYYGVSGFPSWLKITTTNTYIDIVCTENTEAKAREIEFYILADEERKSVYVKQLAVSSKTVSSKQ